MLLWLLALALTAPLAEGGCRSQSDFLKEYSTVVNGPRGEGVYLETLNLGDGPKITIFCLSITESPTVPAECARASIAHLCRNNVSASSCQSLAEYTYSESKEVSRGTEDGPSYTWLLAWDGRGKGDACYPRSISITILSRTSHPAEGGSLAISIIAIIVVSILILVILLVIFSYMHHQSLRARNAEYGEEQMEVEAVDDTMPRVKQRELYNTAYPVEPMNPLDSFSGDPTRGYGTPGQRLVQSPEAVVFDGASPTPITARAPTPPVILLPPQSPASGYPPPSPTYPSPSRGYRTPSPPGEALTVTCADCGHEIGHPRTPATCTATGAIHPPRSYRN